MNAVRWPAAARCRRGFFCFVGAGMRLRVFFRDVLGEGHMFAMVDGGEHPRHGGAVLLVDGEELYGVEEILLQFTNDEGLEVEYKWVCPGLSFRLKFPE